MYEVDVPKSVYEHWDCYGTWLLSTDRIFNAWVVKYYPEVLSVRWGFDGGDDVMNRHFVFESEEHYNWFLLRQ
jgi:hypothetical protein